MEHTMDTRPDGPRDAIYSTGQIQHLMRVEFSRAQRYGYPLSLLIVRADEVERLRAAYGFEFAADLDHQVAQAVRERIRGCDHIGTLVDRSVMLVLPHTDRVGAEALGRRLVEAGAGLRLEHEGRPVPVSLSVGASSFEAGNTMFFDALTEAAEGALGAAREAGGGRFELRDPGVGS
jgi:diguanylate cyclase (GGDEF)-like protein